MEPKVPFPPNSNNYEKEQTVKEEVEIEPEISNTLPEVMQHALDE